MNRKKTPLGIKLAALLCFCLTGSRGQAGPPTFIIEEPDYPYNGGIAECKNGLDNRFESLNQSARLMMIDSLLPDGWIGLYQRDDFESYIEHVMDPNLVFGGTDDEFDDNKDLAVLHVHGGLDEEKAIAVWDHRACGTGYACTCEASFTTEYRQVALGLIAGQVASNAIIHSCCSMNIYVHADHIYAHGITQGVSQMFGSHGTFWTPWDGDLKQFYELTRETSNLDAWCVAMENPGYGAYDGYNSPAVFTFGANAADVRYRMNDASLARGTYRQGQAGEKYEWRLFALDNGCYGCCNVQYCGMDCSML